AARHQIFGLPHRLELRLVTAQSVEVIEVLAVAEHEVADAMPRWRERVTLEPGQWRHPEVEPLIALSAAPFHQLTEQVIHGTAVRFVAEPHQVHRELVPRTG